MFQKYITEIWRSWYGFWTLCQKQQRLKIGNRKYLICTVERSIWMKNRLEGSGHRSESRRAVRRLLKDHRQEVMARISIGQCECRIVKVPQTVKRQD